MRIFNEEKTIELITPDLSRGYLRSDKLFIARHDAIEAVEEKGHYETIKKYENGGEDVAWVVDVPAVEAQDAWDEYEAIQVYVPYTESELKERTERKELVDLERWFTEVYDAQVKQYERCKRLGIEYDNKYGTIEELDKQATANAKRISELRNIYSVK